MTQELRIRVGLAALGLLFGGGMLLLPSLLEGREERLEEGNVGGYVGVAYWPAKSKEDPIRADPHGFDVVLMPTDGRTELRYPAGEWFLPPDGKYRVVVASQDRISPFPSVLAFARAPFEGHGLGSVHPVFPAGSIHVAAPRFAGADLELRALHTESHTWLGGLGPEMAREARFENLGGARLTMPAGEVAVALLDRDADEYRAVGRLVVSPGRQVDWAPTSPPKGRAALVVVARRAEKEPLRAAAEDDVQFFWSGPEGTALPADLRIGTNRKVFAFWFDLPSGDGRVAVSSARSWLEPRETTLRSEHVERLEIELRKNPSLGVRLEVPEGLDIDPRAVEVEVLAASSGRRIVGRLEPGSLEARFSAVPPEPLSVSARLPPWELRGRADLSDGGDGELVLRAESLVVFGTVSYGERAVPARIDIGTSQEGDELRIETDEEGNYRALLVEPKTYLFSVRLRDRDAPWVVPIDVEASGRVDLRVPANAVEFRVSDRETGEPVPGAAVLLDNRGEDGLKTSQRLATDREGRARAHPLRPGSLEFVVQASGYLASAPDSEEIPDSEEEYELELAVELEPLGDEVPVHLELWDGRPAASAEVLVPGPGVPPGWLSRADDRGTVRVPEALAGSPLVIRHPSAGPSVRSVPSEERRLPLPPPDGERAMLRIVDAAGDPMPWAVVVLYVDGVRLGPEATRWLTGAHPAANGDGLWSWNSVPKNRAEVLAVAPGSHSVDLARLGTFDGDRRRLPAPSLGVLEIRAIP